MTALFPKPQHQAILAQLLAVVAEVTGLAPDRIDPGQPLETYGISSAMIVELTAALKGRLDGVSTSLFFEFRNLDALASHLAEHLPPAATAASAVPIAESAPIPALQAGATTDDDWLADWLDAGPATDAAWDIAIIAMSGRYPGAPDLARFWANLCAGTDSVTEVPADRWPVDAWFDPDPEREDRVYSRWGGFLDGIDQFDARFFNIAPREARRMDPQERLFLHEAWACLEGAGLTREALAGSRTGVFVGAMWSLYQLYGAEATARGTPDIASSSFASIANRLSWFLDLRGPSMTVDTMCSSSLTALHLALAALRRGECDQALVGGVNICSHPAKYLHLSRGAFAARDGRCRAFGEGGSGYVPGEGVGVVLLKPLARAQAEGDDVLAVIRASAINHGGHTHGYTVPSPQGQNGCIAAALAASGLAPEQVVYVEAHGTGTALGDPIEVEGLLRSYGGGSAPLRLGSVKSNIGHLESAAGLAGLHKIVLQMRHGALVPSLHADRLNPHIDWNRLNVRVQRGLEPFRLAEGQAMALSAFGAGGANAHVIVVPAPDLAGVPADGLPRPVLISAAHPAALRQHLEDLAAWLAREGQGASLPRIAHALAFGRDAMPARLAFMAADHAALADGIAATLSGRDLPGDLPGPVARWRDGANVAPADLWPHPAERRVALPPRPLEPQRHWLADPLGPEGVVADVAQAPAPRGAAQVSAYAGHWLPVALGQSAPPALILHDDAAVGLAAELAARFGAVPHRALSVAGAEDMTVPTVLVLTAAPGDAAPVSRLRPVLDRVQKRAAFALLHLHAGPDEPVVADLLRLLPAEHTHVRAAAGRAEQADQAVALWRAFASGDLPGCDLLRLAETGPERLAYAPIALPTPTDLCVAEGWLIITGGTGGIGLQLAAHLARAGARRIVLTGRQPMPPRADWPALIAAAGTDPALRARLAALSALPEGLRLVQWDLTDAKAMTAALAALADEAPIARVIHLAGVVDPAATMLADKPEAAVMRILSAKVEGARVLLQALSSMPETALILGSSQSAALPRLAPGVLDYAAANATLNRLALDARAAGRKVSSLMLPNWLGAGFGTSTSPQMARLDLQPVIDAQGLQLFEAAFASDAAVILGAGHGPGFDLSAALRPATPPMSAPPSVTAPLQIAAPDQSALIRRMAEAFAPVLDLDPADWGPRDAFATLGVDSVLLTRLGKRLEAIIGAPVAADVMIEHDTLETLATWVAAQMPVAAAPMATLPAAAAPASPVVIERPPAPVAQSALTDRGIAIIGIGTVLPGAETAAEYWQNLIDARDLVTEVPADRWPVDQFFRQPGPLGTVGKWGGFVAGLDRFQPADFALPAGVGEATDPLLRLALWATRGAICDAGLRDGDLAGADVGVFMGSRVANWADRLPQYHRETVLGTAQNFIAAHVSHWLDLRGPAVVVDTACSSSLYALHLACQSLLTDDCTIALAGGSEYLLDERPWQILGQTGAMSPSGRCRSFDAGADGFVPGEGAVVLVLKRLHNALIDGDRILAVIEASAVNNDGRTMGVTTPNPVAQKAVIRKAMALAGARAADMTCIEAHGTGTQLGDPMELKGLAEVFAELGGAAPGACGIGSVKSAMGHLLSAAGAAATAKMALALHHGILPPTLHCAAPNPRFRFDQSPFFPVQSATPMWTEPGQRRAGINAFGFGGTNVHLQLSDRHLRLAYAPARVPLPVPARDGPHAWHPRPDADLSKSLPAAEPAARSGFRLVRNS